MKTEDEKSYCIICNTEVNDVMYCDKCLADMGWKPFTKEIWKKCLKSNSFGRVDNFKVYKAE